MLRAFRQAGFLIRRRGDEKLRSVIWAPGPFASAHDKTFAWPDEKRKAKKPLSAKLADLSVDEIHIHNAFTQSPFQKTLKNVLVEARRVLKHDGEIYVAHTRTPQACPPKMFKKATERMKFNLEYLIAPGGRKFSRDEIDLLKSLTGGRHQEGSRYPDSFLARLTKKQ